MMPAVWTCCSPQDLAEGVADLLVSALRLETLYIRLQTCDAEASVVAWREKSFLGLRPSITAAERKVTGGHPEHLGLPAFIANYARDPRLRMVVSPVGVEGDCGHIVSWCSRADFPSELDKLLLSVAANQAMTAFQLHWARAKLARAFDDLRTSQQRELEGAAFIQQKLMAMNIPQPPFAAVTGRSAPCKAVGGDFFSVASINGGLALVIADVSGKGTPAAIMASLLQGMILADLHAGLAMTEIVRSANKFLCSQELDVMYATLVITYVRADGELEYINCGHIPPLVARQSGSVDRLLENNVPVGLLVDAEFASTMARLSAGDRLVLVTDGITEAEDPSGEFFGDQRLEESAKGEKPVEEILASVEHFCQGRPGRLYDCGAGVRPRKRVRSPGQLALPSPSIIGLLRTKFPVFSLPPCRSWNSAPDLFVWGSFPKVLVIWTIGK